MLHTLLIHHTDLLLHTRVIFKVLLKLVCLQEKLDQFHELRVDVNRFTLDLIKCYEVLSGLAIDLGRVMKTEALS